MCSRAHWMCRWGLKQSLIQRGGLRNQSVIQFGLPRPFLRGGGESQGKNGRGAPQKEIATTGDPAFQAPGINRLGLRAHRGRPVWRT